MSFHSWLQNLRSALAPLRDQRKHPRRGSPRAPTHRLNLEVLEDRCLPSFSPLTSFPVGPYPQAVVTADFNNDTVPDLAVAGNNSVSVLLGNGDGTFDLAQTSATGNGPRSVAVGDFDRDDNLDVVTANAFNVSVLLGNGDGTFTAASNIYVNGDEFLSVAVGDFDGDGLLDLGVTSNLYVYDDSGASGHYEGHANVLVGNGSGTFSGPNTTSLGYGYHTSAAAADFDGDGIDDFATANPEFPGVSVLLGDASGYLQGPVNFCTGTSFSVVVADVDGDLDADLVTVNYNYNGSVSVLLGDGTGGFGGAQNYATGSYSHLVAVADCNGDDKLDIVTTSDTYTRNSPISQLNVLLGHGDGTFASPINRFLDAGTYASALAAGDFNGDGLADVAVTTSESGSGRVSVLLNTGDWPFPATLAISDVTRHEGRTHKTTVFTFTVTLSAACDQPVTVSYRTLDGTATTSDNDYVAKTGTLTFAPGETTKTITIVVNGDSKKEANETFDLDLFDLSSNALFTKNRGIGTILNDD